MPRYRSRQIETESVNPRLLRRGAVKRQHISRWAVGHDELAPGVVGPGHLQPTVIERIIEQGAGTGIGELIHLTGTAVDIASGGDYLVSDTIVRQVHFADMTAPGEAVILPQTSIYAVELEFAWDDWDGGGTVEIELNGVTRRVHPDTGTGRRFEWAATIDAFDSEELRVKVTQTSGDTKAASWDLTVAAIEPVGRSSNPTVIGFSSGVSAGDEVEVALPEDIHPGDLLVAIAVNVTATYAPGEDGPRLVIVGGGDPLLEHLLIAQDMCVGYRILDGTETTLEAAAYTAAVNDDTLRCACVVVRGATGTPVLVSANSATSPVNANGTGLVVSFGRGTSPGATAAGDDTVTVTGPTGYTETAAQAGSDPIVAGHGPTGTFVLSWSDVDITAGDLLLVEVS